MPPSSTIPTRGYIRSDHRHIELLHELPQHPCCLSPLHIVIESVSALSIQGADTTKDIHDVACLGVGGGAGAIPVASASQGTRIPLDLRCCVQTTSYASSR
jgi:hypothetical protein